MLLFLVRKLLVTLGYPRLDNHLIGPYPHVGAIQTRVVDSTACQIFYPASLTNGKTARSNAPYFRPQAVQGLIDYLRFGDGLLQLLSEKSHPCEWQAEPLRMDDEDGFPLVIFSHGLAGTFEMYTELCQHIASLGYCVVALEHEDGSAAYAQSSNGNVIPYKRPNDEPYSRQKVLKLRTPMLDHRVKEMENVIRHFQRHQKKTTINTKSKDDKHMQLLDRVIEATDLNKLHLVGHSFGGATQMLAAQRWTDKDNTTNDDLCLHPLSLMVLDCWAFSLQEHVVERGLSQNSKPINILSVISEDWEQNNPERKQIAEYLHASEANSNNHITSMVAPNAVHQSFSDSEAWFPSFVAQRVRNRGKGEDRHVTIRGVVEAWSRMNDKQETVSDTSTPTKSHSRKGNRSILQPWIMSCIMLISLVFHIPSTNAFSLQQQSSENLFQNSMRVPTTRFNDPSNSATTLFANSNKEDSTTASSISIRFSGRAADTLVSSDNPLDQLLAWLSSDIVSIVLGSVGLLAIVINRLALLDANLATADALTYETRADLLAVFACGSVLLNGVTKLDVTTALAESVVLEGTTVSPEILDDTSDKETRTFLTWALESILSATPAKTAVFLTQANGGWSVYSRGGTVPTSKDNALQVPDKSPILDRVGSPGNTKETYLPTLQALPGRFEFTYLPSNTQLALLIPIASSSSSNDGGSVLVLGSNTAKSFSPRDIAWSRVIADRIGASGTGR